MSRSSTSSSDDGTASVPARAGRRREAGSRPIAIVLGMHRSGTSLLSNVMHYIGCEMADDTDAISAKNPGGFWERPAIVALHDEILAAIGRPVGDPRHVLPFPAGWWRRKDVQRVKQRLIDHLREELDATDDLWGFKDPRTCRMLPLWEEIFRTLNLTPIYVQALRAPEPASRSMELKNVKLRPMSSAISELMWLAYNYDTVRYTAAHEMLIVDYEDWFDNTEATIERLANFLPLEFPLSKPELEDIAYDLVTPGFRNQTETPAGQRRRTIGRTFYDKLRQSEDVREDRAVQSQLPLIELIFKTVEPLVEQLAASKTAEGDLSSVQLEVATLQAALEEAKSRAEVVVREQAGQTDRAVDDLTAENRDLQQQIKTLKADAVLANEKILKGRKDLELAIAERDDAVVATQALKAARAAADHRLETVTEEALKYRNDLSRAMLDADRGLEDHRRQATDALRALREQMDQASVDTAEKIAALKADAVVAAEKIVALRKSAEVSTEELAKARDLAANAGQELVALRKAAETSKEELAKARDFAASAEEERVALRKAAETSAQALADERQKAEALDEALTVLTRERDRLLAEVATLQAAIETTASKALEEQTRARADVETAAAQMVAIREALGAAESRIETATAEASTLAQARTGLLEELEALRAEITALSLEAGQEKETGLTLREALAGSEDRVVALETDLRTQREAEADLREALSRETATRIALEASVAAADDLRAAMTGDMGIDRAEIARLREDFQMATRKLADSDAFTDASKAEAAIERLRILDLKAALSVALRSSSTEADPTPTLRPVQLGETGIVGLDAALAGESPAVVGTATATAHGIEGTATLTGAPSRPLIVAARVGKDVVAEVLTTIDAHAADGPVGRFVIPWSSIPSASSGKPLKLSIVGPNTTLPGPARVPDLDRARRRAESGEHKSIDAWLRRHHGLTSEARLEAEAWYRSRIAEWPLVSLIILGPGNADEAARSIASGLDQVYDRIEILVPQSLVSGPIQDARVRSVETDTLSGLLAAATGPLVGFVQAGDVLANDALIALVTAAQATEDPVALVYSDEDRFDPITGLRSAPVFKGGWSPDLMLSSAYALRLSLVSLEQVRTHVGPSAGAEMASAYRAVLGVSLNRGSRDVLHVPHVLYSRTEDRDDDRKAFDKARGTALTGHKPPVDLNRSGDAPTLDWSLPSVLPRVSIVVPTRDRLDLLRPCIDGLLDDTDYDDIEIVIVDNESTDKPTLAYLKKIARDPRVTVVKWAGAFDYSAINNFAVAQTSGPLVALLNNDIKVIEPGWLTAMVRQVLRPDVGAVGARLLYADGSLQHAGVVLGIGAASHIYKTLPADHCGHDGRLSVAHDVSAVTAACILVRREVWDEVGGLSLEFPVAYNDVDLCLAIRAAGYRVLYEPRATLYHLESQSRGLDDAGDKKKRLAKDRDRLLAKWGGPFEDPFYSPNLTLKATDAGLANPPRIGRSWLARPRGASGQPPRDAGTVAAAPDRSSTESASS